MNWNVSVDDDAKKYCAKIPKRDAERIATVLLDMETNPYMGDIEKMRGEDSVWRRRVGSYRIMYEIFAAQKIIYIADIRRRTSKTY